MDLQTTLGSMSGDPKKDIKMLTDYIFALQEELRYLLNNLDVTNFNDLGLARYENGRLQIYTEQLDLKLKGINVDITGLDESLRAEIEASAENLTIAYKKADQGLDESLSSKITLSAEELTTAFQNADKALNTSLSSKITQSAAGVTAEFKKADTALNTSLSSKITASAEEVTAEFKNADKALDTSLSSKITASAEGLTTEFTAQIGSLSGKVDGLDTKVGTFDSRITQNAESINTVVTATIPALSGKVDGLSGTVSTFESSITQNANLIQLLVTGTDPNTATIKAASIMTAINKDGSEAKIKADKIEMTGTTTFLTAADVGATGTTEIDGGRIKAGTVIEGPIIRSIQRQSLQMLEIKNAALDFYYYEEMLGYIHQYKNRMTIETRTEEMLLDCSWKRGGTVIMNLQEIIGGENYQWVFDYNSIGLYKNYGGSNQTLVGTVMIERF